MKASIWVCVLLVLATSLGLAAPTRAQNNLSGTLTVYLQAYYGPAVDPETAAIAEEIAAAYEAEHPGVDIQLIENLPDSTDMETFLAARMAANQSPDIMWQQFATRNLRGEEWWVPLNEFLERPNPYIAAGTPGHERWADSFPDFVMAQTRAGDGNWYQVSLDWVESGLYYNKDLFAQAGVDPENWTDWTTFFNDMTKIRETTGVDPLGSFQLAQGWSSWAWADDIFLTVAWADMADSLYMEKYDDPNRPWRQLNPEEIARAILDGKLDATDPRMDDYLRISKQFVSLLPIDYTSILSLEDLDPLFYSGEVASVWTGTWKSKPYAENVPFEYGVTYLPPFTTEDSPHAQGTAYRVGGPSSAGQYGIAQSAAANGKLDLAADFLMYVSAPQNFERLAVSSGSFIPMVAGASAPDAVAGFGDVAELPERLFNDPDSRLTLESSDQWSTAMQAYFLGEADEEATKARLQEIWMEGATRLCTDNGYDWCPAS